MIGVYNNKGYLVTSMGIISNGGLVTVHNNNEGNFVALVSATLLYGKIELKTLSGQTVWSAP